MKFSFDNSNLNDRIDTNYLNYSDTPSAIDDYFKHFMTRMESGKIIKTESSELSKFALDGTDVFYNATKKTISTDYNIDELKRKISMLLILSNKSVVEIILFLQRVKKIKNVIAILDICGLIALVLTIYITNAIGKWFFCYIIWIIGCFSLWCTLKLIIREWNIKVWEKGIKKELLKEITKLI